MLIGQKGPERLERQNYPPVLLEPGTVTPDAAAGAWTYHAKDSGSGAEVSVRLNRQPCGDTLPSPPGASEPPPPSKTGAPAPTSLPPAETKYTFRIILEHAQIGTLNGCARIAAEMFPKIINQSSDDDTEKKKPPVTAVIKFKAPTAIAFINAAGKIVVSRGALKKIAAPSGSDLSLSHDGKKLLYTRSESKMGSEAAIVLYDFETGRSKDLLKGAVREAFWSIDDSRVACLRSQDQHWQVISFRTDNPDNAAILYSGNATTLGGWVDNHTVLAADAQNLYWVGDDKPQQTVALREIYGEAFRVGETDSIRVNPVNSEVLLVSSAYAFPPAGGPADAAAVFSFELRSKRRVVLSPADQWARHGEWSRDGVQVFYTRRSAAASGPMVIYRVFWDGSAPRRYQDGSDLVVGQ